MPKISIIVPVYKVEKFLNKCLDSVLGQSFTDFDLVLIDDGSPDNSGKICDEYAAKDNRIKVIHKENGGQSSARNVGLEWAFKNSDSEYIYFADADDYIDSNLLSVTYAEIVKQNADIVCFGLKMVNEFGQELDWGKMKLPKEKVFGYKSRFRPILSRFGYADYPVNKLYKKKLLEGIRFPEGCIFEDVYITYKIFDRAQKIVLLNRYFYYYVRYLGSTTRRVGDKRYYHFFYASEEKYNYISKATPKYRYEAIAGVATSIYTCIRTIFWQKNLADFSEDISFFRTKIQEYWGVIKKSRFVDKRHKKTLKLFVKDVDLCEKFMNKKKSDFNFIDFCKGLLCKIIKRR